MDLGADLGVSCTSSAVLAHVLDSSAIVSSAVKDSSSYTSGLAVLTPTLDGHGTVTSLSGFSLNSFDAVDVSGNVVKNESQDHNCDLAVATVGEDIR